MAKATSGGGKKATPPSKDDYTYAKEVAGQPATTPEEVIQKTRAKLDKKYLEDKYPGLKDASTQSGVIRHRTYTKSI